MYGKLPEVKVGDQTVNGVTVRVPNPPKTAILGLPTYEQVIERLDGQKSIRRNLGRRKSQIEPQPNTKADLTLFNKIRLDKDGPEFDEFEATSIVGKLLYVDSESCDHNGDQYVVVLTTHFGNVTHVMNAPTQRDLQKYRRTVVTSVDLPHGLEELRTRTTPACELYDSVIVSIDGYTDAYKANTVPPHHKSAAVIELVQALEEMDPLLDPNF